MTTVVEAIDLKKTYIIGKVSVKALGGINLKVERGDQQQEQEYAPGAAVTQSMGLTISPVLTPSVFAGAFAFGLLVSIVFALYPAWRASKLKPVDALRYE